MIWQLSFLAPALAFAMVHVSVLCVPAAIQLAEVLARQSMLMQFSKHYAPSRPKLAAHLHELPRVAQTATESEEPPPALRMWQQQA